MASAICTIENSLEPESLEEISLQGKFNTPKISTKKEKLIVVPFQSSNDANGLTSGDVDFTL